MDPSAPPPLSRDQHDVPDAHDSSGPGASFPAEPSPCARSLVIACEMIDDEVHMALERAAEQGAVYPLIWMPAGLHERPQKMQAYLQDVLDRIDHGNLTGDGATLPSIEPGSGPPDDRRTELVVGPADDVLMAVGYCGNGILGLSSQTARLAFPRVDDCISLFLNHGCRREEIDRDARAFYLTRGWICHDNPFIGSYRAWVARYGQDQAERFRRVVLAGYERITLLDTGAYDLEATVPDSERLAAELQLDHELVPGSVSLLERLFLGPWDSEIVRVPPGEPITIWHLLGRD